MSEVPTPSIAKIPQLGTLLVIGGLSVGAAILFALGITQAITDNHGAMSQIVSRGEFVLASTAAVMTTVLACKYGQRNRASALHADVITGAAANYVLLEQLTAKVSDLMKEVNALNGRMDEATTAIENKAWEIFGEMAINSSNVVPFARSGHNKEH